MAIGCRDNERTELRYALANLQYQAGHFATAKETLQAPTEAGEASDDAKLLMGELEYLTGNYAAAGEILLDLKSNASDLVYFGSRKHPRVEVAFAENYTRDNSYRG